jgi:putative membrane protein
MAEWNSALYMKFENERMRTARLPYACYGKQFYGCILFLTGANALGTVPASTVRSQEFLMLVRLSMVLAVICMLSGAALAQGAAKLTDAQIAHIAYTAGQLDIEGAKQAISKSTNKDVRAFADGMVRDHTAVNKQALDLVHKLKVALEDNDLSRSLTEQAADKRAELAKLKGAEFDKAYLANEVAYHLAVNGALEITLIPSATNPDLKSLLQTGLKIFQGHQQHAREVASALK